LLWILLQDKEQKRLEEKLAAARVAKYAPPTDADFSAALTGHYFDDESPNDEYEGM
jgi:hypothetical protein